MITKAFRRHGLNLNILSMNAKFVADDSRQTDCIELPSEQFNEKTWTNPQQRVSRLLQAANAFSESLMEERPREGFWGTKREARWHGMRDCDRTVLIAEAREGMKGRQR